MKHLTNTIMIALILIILTPALSEARKKQQDDIIGPEEPMTFTRSKTLPGPIDVNFSVVTLAKYNKEVDGVFNYTFAETEKIARKFLQDDPASDLARIANSAGTEPVRVSRETLVLAEHAREIADWTLGAFDPVRGGGTYHNLKIDKNNSTVYLTKPGLSLEFKGIIEGFIADLFIRAAYHANLEDAFVRVNGVSRAMGHDSFGSWNVIIEGDGKRNAKHGMSVSISNYALATAGSRYGFHPNASPLYDSVTVLTKQAATAEGVANAIYAMKDQSARDLVFELGIRAIFAHKNGRLEKIGKW